MNNLIVSGDGFRVEGMLSFETAPLLRSEGEKLITACTADHMIVDLSGIQEQDASCLALLLAWMHFAKQQKKSIILRFVKAPLSLQRMQKLFGLEKIICLENHG